MAKLTAGGVENILIKNLFYQRKKYGVIGTPGFEPRLTDVNLTEKRDAARCYSAFSGVNMGKQFVE